MGGLLGDFFGVCLEDDFGQFLLGSVFLGPLYP